MNKVYILYHVYEKNSALLIDEVKILGVFSSEKNAAAAIEYYKTLPGFRDFDKSCFEVSESILGREDWSEGFITVYS